MLSIERDPRLMIYFHLSRPESMYETMANGAQLLRCVLVRRVGGRKGEVKERRRQKEAAQPGALICMDSPVFTGSTSSQDQLRGRFLTN